MWQGGDKIDPKTVKCIFLGYSRIQKGYKCYTSYLHKKFISVDVTFHKFIYFYSECEKFQKDHFREIVDAYMHVAGFLEKVHHPQKKNQEAEEVYIKKKESTISS